MSSTADPARRAALLSDVLDHLHEHGVADLSLEPLARAIGTSKRMLLYYFGDRATLVAEVLAASRPDVARMFAAVRGPADLRAAAGSLWYAISRGEQRRSVRMLLQVLALATTKPDVYGEFAATSVHVLTGPVADAFARAGWDPVQSATRATLVVSGLRGLCQDLLVTGDVDRVDAAAAALLDWVVA
ncbi:MULTISPECIES: TetR/AcrR family transcriptional regulator [unclassified Modestobacter]